MLKEMVTSKRWKFDERLIGNLICLTNERSASWTSWDNFNFPPQSFQCVKEEADSDKDDTIILILAMDAYYIKKMESRRFKVFHKNYSKKSIKVLEFFKF
jgi:hypothetical protein